MKVLRSKRLNNLAVAVLGVTTATLQFWLVGCGASPIQAPTTQPNSDTPSAGTQTPTIDPASVGSSTPSQTADFLSKADAGPDQLIPDADGDGFEQVTLNVESTNGSIAEATWSIGDVVIGYGSPMTTTLPVGIHVVSLMVEYTDGQAGRDQVVVAVGPRFEAAATTGDLVVDGGQEVVAADLASVTVRPRSADASNFQSGDIYAGFSPDGRPFLRRVISAESRSDGTTRLETEFAEITDAVESGSVEIEGYRLTPEASYEAAVAGEQAKAALSKIDLYNETVEFENDDFSMSASANITFDPEVDFKLDVGLCGFKPCVKKAKLVARGELDADLDFVVEAKRPFSNNYETRIGDVHRFQPIVFFIGPVPVAICPTLEFFLGVDASATHAGAITVTENASFFAEGGFKCKRGDGCDLVSNADFFVGSPVVDYQLPGTVEVTGYVKAVLSFEMYCNSLTKARVTAQPYLNLTAEYFSANASALAIAPDPVPGSDVIISELCYPDADTNRVDYALNLGLNGSVGGRFFIFDGDYDLPFDLEAQILSGRHCFERTGRSLEDLLGNLDLDALLDQLNDADPSDGSLPDIGDILGQTPGDLSDILGSEFGDSGDVVPIPKIQCGVGGNSDAADNVCTCTGIKDCAEMLEKVCAKPNSKEYTHCDYNDQGEPENCLCLR